MLAEGVWAPTGGLLAVAGITSGCLLAQSPLVRDEITARAASVRKVMNRPAARAALRGTKARLAWLGRAGLGSGAVAHPGSSAPVAPAAKAAPDAAAPFESGRPRP